jgi:hypothetical protein
MSKTKEALALLKNIKAIEDIEHVKDSKKIRRGTGKMRNRRYVERKGPLLVYASNNGIEQGFRNIPGMEIACVDRLNLLKLAPGGHLGRFVIWTQAAFEKLDRCVFFSPGCRMSGVGCRVWVLPRAPQQLLAAEARSRRGPTTLVARDAQR